MEKFTNQILEFYLSYDSSLRITRGYEIRNFNVYADLQERLLVLQIDYYDNDGSLCHIDSTPDNDAFEVFSAVYMDVQREKSKSVSSISYEDVINEMQNEFLDIAIPKGFQKNVAFSIMFIPLVINPVEIPLELLLQAEDKILRN
jgi:hypothetical protein